MKKTIILVVIVLLVIGIITNHNVDARNAAVSNQDATFEQLLSMETPQEMDKGAETEEFELDFNQVQEQNEQEDEEEEEEQEDTQVQNADEEDEFASLFAEVESEHELSAKQQSDDIEAAEAEALAAVQGTGDKCVSEKSFVTSLILAILVGGLGIDRMYLGLWLTGIIKLVVNLLTCGGLGIWQIIDIVLIATKSMHDGAGCVVKPH